MKSQKKTRPASRMELLTKADYGRIVSISDEGQYLDTAQLNQLEQSFRDWVNGSRRADIRSARQRVLIIFLLIRYTGAKVSEVLALNPLKDIDWTQHSIVFRGGAAGSSSEPREVQISEGLSREIRSTISEPSFRSAGDVLDIDPGFVRRTFYNRADACGFSRRLGGPETIRKARAVELMRNNMPLPAVQMMLGHSTPNLTSSYVSFSKDEIQQVARLFVEKEFTRKTSARNSFFGKVQNIRRGDTLSHVKLTTIEGLSISAMITNDSAERLALKRGRLITAEVKATWIILYLGDEEPPCSVENRFRGHITRINKGKMNSDCVIRISDATELCAVVSTAGSRGLNVEVGEQVWALFSCFSVVLHID